MKPHRSDLVSLGAGLAFLALAGWWMTERTEIGVHGGWIVAAVLIALGAASLGSGLAPARRAPDHESAADL